LYAKLDAAATKGNLTIEGNRVGKNVGDKVELGAAEKRSIVEKGMGLGSDGNVYISKEALEYFKKAEKGGQSGFKKGEKGLGSSSKEGIKKKGANDNIVKPYTGPNTGYKSKVEVGELNKGVVLSGEAKATIVNTINKGNIDEIIKVFNKEANWDISKALNKVPENLWENAKRDFADKGVGIKFYSQKGGGDIRIMKGKPDGKPKQQVDYVKVVSGGKVVLSDGRKISSKDHPNPSWHPDAHIPVNEWKNWKTWDEK
jgi:hypothetical protein